MGILSFFGIQNQGVLNQVPTLPVQSMICAYRLACPRAVCFHAPCAPTRPYKFIESAVPQPNLPTIAHSLSLQVAQSRSYLHAVGPRAIGDWRDSLAGRRAAGFVLGSRLSSSTGPGANEPRLEFQRDTRIHNPVMRLWRSCCW